MRLSGTHRFPSFPVPHEDETGTGSASALSFQYTIELTNQRIRYRRKLSTAHAVSSHPSAWGLRVAPASSGQSQPPVLMMASCHAENPHVVEENPFHKYQAAIDQWDRVLLRGSRQGLADAAGELRAMGEAVAPLAEQLLRRVAELDADGQRRQRLLDWCDRSPTRRLVLMGDARGIVGWVSTEALPEDRAEKINEEGRRLIMIGVAREARHIEEAATGAPVLVELGCLPGEMLEQGPAFDWRFDRTRAMSSTPARSLGGGKRTGAT